MTIVGYPKLDESQPRRRDPIAGDTTSWRIFFIPI
jgi:hypothetical protein